MNSEDIQRDEKRVMFVDDEEFVRQSLADYFEDYLWHTCQAASGEEALALLEVHSPNAAVVDIRMGGIDGNAFIRNAAAGRPEMVFVICTGSPEYDLPPDLLNMPCVSKRLFRKPVPVMKELEDELIRMIRTVKGQ